MGSSENDGSNKQTTGNDAQEEVNIYEDEINLMDYFQVLWKRKNLVLLGSILPALLAVGILLLLPRDYTLTYTYDIKDPFRDQLRDPFRDSFRDQLRDHTIMDMSNWNLDEKSYNVFLNLFYSGENLGRIIDRLQKEGVNEYAKLIGTARKRSDQEKLVKFEAFPPYVDISKVKETDPTKLEHIRELKAQLLNMTITGRPKKDIFKISSVIRNNLENVIPVYLVAEQLDVAIREVRVQMAGIEGEKFAVQLDLEKARSVLAKLKDIEFGTTGRTERGIVLQFDVGRRSEFLPIEHQIQTAESRIITLEETIKNNEKQYEYYKDLLSLNENLFAEVKNKALSDYTIQQFRLFLLESVKEAEKEELKDYLSSYTKRIENRIAASVPVTENPSTYAVSKGTAKKSAIVFVIALMLSVFAAFLLEGLQKSRARAS